VLQPIVPVPSLAPQAVPRRSTCIILPVVASLDKVRHLHTSHTPPASHLPQRPRPHHVPELLQPPVRQLASLRIPTCEHKRPARQARLAIAIESLATALASASRPQGSARGSRFGAQPA